MSVDKSKLFKNGVGKFRDIIRHNDGRVEVKEWSNNIIVRDMGKLACALLKRDSSYVGISYWAIGSGNVSWDTTPYTPLYSNDSLVNEIGRKIIPVGNIIYLDEFGTPSGTPTNSIQITLLFTNGDVNGDWREFAIYGGDASGTIGSGIMINHKEHPILIKDETRTVERQMIFIFE